MKTTEARAVIRRSAVESQEGLTAQINTVSQGGMGFIQMSLWRKPLRSPLSYCPVPVWIWRNILEDCLGLISGKELFYGISFEREISYDRFIEMIG